MNRTRAKKLLSSGRVQVNGEIITRHDCTVKESDRVRIVATKPTASLTILYEDQHLIAIDKPQGLLSVATESEKIETAFARLAAQIQVRPFVVHRLDRETSGVLLFAKSSAIRDRLQADWDKLVKQYLAGVDVMPAVPEFTSFEVRTYLREDANLRTTSFKQCLPRTKLAVSKVRILRPDLLSVFIQTGRKHQIRVHLASIGCPILGDEVYGGRPAKRLMLHAHQLIFDHPVTQHRIEIVSPAPQGLQ